MTNKTAIPFFYVVTTTAAIAGNGTGRATLTMDQDADFQLFAWRLRTSLDAVGDIESNNVTVEIRDQATGRLFQNAALPQSLFAGRNTIGPAPLINFRPGTILDFTFVNLTANSMTPTLVMIGTKLYEGIA